MDTQGKCRGTEIKIQSLHKVENLTETSYHKKLKSQKAILTVCVNQRKSQSSKSWTRDWNKDEFHKTENPNGQ